MASFMGRSGVAPASSNGNGTHDEGGIRAADVHANGNGTHDEGGIRAADVHANGNGTHDQAGIRAADVHANGNGTHGTAEAAASAAEAGVKKPASGGLRLGEDLVSPRPTGDPNRDKLGRFQPNNHGGPGNPFGRAVARNRRLILATFSEEEVMAILRKLQEQALGGNVAASKLLLQYLVGKPAAAANPDRVNHEEWELRREQPTVAEVESQKGHLPHGLALVMERAADIGKAETMKQAWDLEGAKAEAREAKQAERAKRRQQRKQERQRRRR